MMKNFASTILLGLLFFFSSAAVFGRVNAQFLDFDKTTATVNVGENIDLGVRIDTGSNQVSSTDAYVLYDPTLLEAVEIAPGPFFPTVVNNITAGRLYIAGLVDDAATSKTGTGIVATVTFRALSRGDATIAYDCQTGVYNSSKIIQNDVDATNIIDCGQSGTSIITIGGTGGSTNLTSTPPVGGTNNTYNGSTTSALPRSGVFDNISRVAVPGMILLFLGGALRLIL